ncbi:MAG: fucose isomerase [Treponema sp.]|jgi:L-fucose isomerase-like protein|nr:fucose isomerase [Treponema sp.]
MYDFSKLTVGIAPTRRDFFPPKEGAYEVKKMMMPVLREIFAKLNVEVVDIDSVNGEGLLSDNADIPAVKKLFLDRGVDALFFPHANFGQEEPVAKLAAEMNLPVLLWGPRDEAPPPKPAPHRQTDIQCGLLATSKALQRYDVPFTYIENCRLDSPVLERDLESFVRVAAAVKAFRGMRILQLSTRPRQFLTVKVNESELLEKFRIEVIPVESAEIVGAIKEVLNNEGPLVKERIAEWKKIYQFDENSEKVIDKLAASAIGIERLAERYDCRGVSGECWSLLSSNFGIRSCFLWGDLINRGLPVACENDIHGCISQILLSAIARGRSPVFLADITIRHPENDNGELLWHCGPFPAALAREGISKEVISCHGAWEIRGGDLTLGRFDAIKGEYLLFADECRGVDGPWTDGNYLWVQTGDWVKWEKKFIYGPYIHHIAGVHGKFKKELAELCVYLRNVSHDNADLPCRR